MIDTAPAKLIDRIHSCERQRDSVLSKFDDQIKAYHASAYGGGTGVGVSENHVFEYVSMRIGQVAFNNPVVKVESTAGEEKRNAAKAAQHALNRWCKDTAFHRVAEKLAMDCFFSFGVAITKPEPVAGWEEAEDPIYWPVISRLDQRCFGFDCEARSYEEARFAFHLVTEDKEDLLKRARDKEDEGWHPEAIEKMAGGVDYEDSRDEQDVYSDGRVSYYEVWIPGLRIKDENTPEKGYHGAIVTLTHDAKEGKSSEIREKRDYWGPRWGPYTLYGMYTVPNKPWPLAPLAAAWKQIEDDNLHADVIDRSAKNYKRFVVGGSKKFAKRVKDAKHDFVYADEEGIVEAKKLNQLEIGGVTEEMLAVKSITKDRADRMLGMSDAEKGMVTGDATATENAVAANAAQVRTSWQSKKFQDACERQLYSVLWYLLTEDSIVPLGEEAPGQVVVGKVTSEAWPRQRKQLMRLYPQLDLPMELPPGVAEDAGKGFDDYEVSIEVGSMGRKDETAEKMEADLFAKTLLEIGQGLVMQPFIKAEPFLEDYGMRRGWPEILRYYDLQMLEMMRGLNVQMMMAGAQEQPGGQGQAPSSNDARVSRTQQTMLPDSKTATKASLPGQSSGAKNGAQVRGGGY